MGSSEVVEVSVVLGSAAVVTVRSLAKVLSVETNTTGEVVAEAVDRSVVELSVSVELVVCNGVDVVTAVEVVDEDVLVCRTEVVTAELVTNVVGCLVLVYVDGTFDVLVEETLVEGCVDDKVVGLRTNIVLRTVALDGCKVVVSVVESVVDSVDVLLGVLVSDCVVDAKVDKVVDVEASVDVSKVENVLVEVELGTDSVAVWEVDDSGDVDNDDDDNK